eukprot:CAMPEP_0185775744 /NCGR_PEP_ID=MMETSP1174-20130828/83191_1 /TAXON_ID=35687 /ORGANISM="Dictyocha speculum, Strain CCMP1381" /LENGTH=146 /DNA_ID=CAMNT_0028463419 /DNA_START=270 /DNA_END=710 /DNA_ORIENTATION=-
MKNLLNGNTQEKTWRAGESMEAASVRTDESQYTYDEGDNLVFMDMESFEETRVDKGMLGTKIAYLKEGMEVKVVTWGDKVIDILIPQVLDIEVIMCDAPIKGETQGKDKPATLEGGIVVTVPAFVKVGEILTINTDESKYMSRASK